MNYLKQFLKGGIFLVVCMMVFGFLNSVSSAALLSDSECQSQGGVCETNNPTCTGKKRIDGCAFANDGQVRTCCGKADADEESENKDVQCAKTHKGTCFHQNQTKDICTVKGMELKGECESENGAEMICCFDSKNPNNAYSSNATSSGTAAALNYTPLENLPGFEGQGGDFATYFKNLYLLALWIVGISALFMLVVGGFLYLSSAGNTSLLGTAKKTIYGALIGLVIALISWLLLDTINSDLTNLKLSGLSGVIGTNGTGSSGSGDTNTGSNGKIPEEYRGKGSGCGGAELQGGSHCEDASQDLSDVLKCMVDKLGSKKMQISSISDYSGGKSIFTQCRDNYAKPPCEHGNNSCHYGGSSKKDKSCAADISGSYMGRTGSASASEVKSAASSCGAGYVLDEGDHVHLSVSGCGCN